MTPICTKSFVGWGFAPDPTGRAYSAPPDHLAILGGLLLKGGGRKRRGKRKEKGERSGWEGWGVEGREFVLCPRKKKSRRP